jgi:hypothetical protein
MRSIITIALLSLALNGAGAVGCDSRQSDSAQEVKQSGNKSASEATATPGREMNKDMSGEMKVLAEGGQSGVSDAFAAVARDAETYAQLRELAGQLPEMSADSFRTNVVVAAFLGRRNTGGFGAQITRADNGALRLSETAPPKDAIVTQALTTPFKVVSVPVTNDQPLTLEMEGEWKSMTRPFRVSTGNFTVTGGIMGSAEDFRLEGEIGLMRQGKLATLFFDLKAAGEKKTRDLKDVATGIVQPDGGIKIARMTGGSLVSPPPTSLRADGKFTDGENNLALSFESLPSNVADGYQGRGKLEATAAAPPPRKRKPSGEGDPV